MVALRRRDWAWEFLRRNARFLEDAYEQAEEVAIANSCLEGGKVLRLNTTQPKAEAWGLLFFPNPDQAAPKADVFWNPSLDPCVVTMMVTPRGLAEKDVMFAVATSRCTIDVLTDTAGTEHLLTRGQYASAQSICSGLSILSTATPFKLDLHMRGPEKMDAAYTAYKRASTILHEGPWVWSERTKRMRNALICLDVKDAGLDLRHAGQIIFGDARVAQDWSSSKSLRDRVRSYYRTGQRLRDGDYLKLLRSSPIDRFKSV